MDTLTFKNHLSKFKLFQWRINDFMFNKSHEVEPLNCISFSSAVINKKTEDPLKKLLFLKNIELLSTSTNKATWSSFYCYYNSKKDLKNIIEVLNILHGKAGFYSGYYNKEHDYILYQKRINKNDFVDLVFPKKKVYENSKV